MLKNQWVGMPDAAFAGPEGFLSAVTVRTETPNRPHGRPSSAGRV